MAMHKARHIAIATSFSKQYTHIHAAYLHALP